MTPYVTEVLLSAPELQKGRQTLGLDPERAISLPAHPHHIPPPSTPRLQLKVTTCSPGGPPGASDAQARGSGGRGAGAGLTVWLCTWH